MTSGIQDFLLVGDLHRQGASDRVGEFRVIVDLADRAQDLGRNLLVELNVAFELRSRPSAPGPRFRPGCPPSLDALDLGLEIKLVAGVALDPGARGALNQNLHGSVWQLQKLQTVRERPM